MKNNQRALLAWSLLATATLASACSDNSSTYDNVGGGGVVVSPPPPPPAVGAARFGAGFAAKFLASITSDPADPVASDIIAPSFTADPLEVSRPDGS